MGRLVVHIGVDFRTATGVCPRGTGRNLTDAFGLLPGLRSDCRFTLYHRRRGAPEREAAGDEGLWASANVREHGFDIPGDRFDLWFQLGLPIAAWRDRVDLLHFPANVAPRWCPAPFIVTVHDLIPMRVAGECTPRDARRFARRMRRSVRRAMHIITPSQATREDLCRTFGVPQAKITVVPWAADRVIADACARISRDSGELERIRRQYALVAPWLLNFSGSSARKNLEAVIRSFAKLPASIRESTPLLIVGCEPCARRAQVLALATDWGVRPHVKLLGFVPHDDLPALLVGSKALLIPSLCEGFGLPILDAFAAGVPIVASNTSSLPEVGGDAVEYCDPRDTTSIAAAIIRVLEPNRATRLVQLGRDRLREFNWARTAEAMCGVYDRCLSRLRTRRFRPILPQNSRLETR